MNPKEIANLLEELIQSEAKVIAFFLLGVGLTVVGTYTIRKWVFPPQTTDKLKAELANKEAEIARNDLKIGGLDHKLDDRDRKIAELNEKRESAEEKHKNEKAVLQERIAELGSSRDALKNGNADIAAKITTLAEQLEKAQSDTNRYQRKADDAAKQHAAKESLWKKNREILKKNEDYYRTRKRHYKTQYLNVIGKLQQVESSNKQLEDIQGRFWEYPVTTAVPPFRKPQSGGATIIAVTNLKGGVGKTTLTASIAVTYRQMGKRVLVVDLDQQSSLTNRCLTEEQISGIKKDGHFVESIFRVGADFASAALKSRTYAKDCDFDILPASETLFDVEEHVKAKWLMNLGGFDIRYVLRSALHDSVFQNGYDIIMLDCPPRWTSASINAMACCDFVLVPMLLDAISAEAVPRLLGWLHNLKAKKVFPDLEILGVIGNNTYRKKPLIRRENTIWTGSPTVCADKWKAPVHHFGNVIKKFSTAEKIAALDEKLRAVFFDLVTEIETRRMHHERIELATIS